MKQLSRCRNKLCNLNHNILMHLTTLKIIIDARLLVHYFTEQVKVTSNKFEYVLDLQDQGF